MQVRSKKPLVNIILFILYKQIVNMSYSIQKKKHKISSSLL